MSGLSDAQRRALDAVFDGGGEGVSPRTLRALVARRMIELDTNGTTFSLTEDGARYRENAQRHEARNEPVPQFGMAASELAAVRFTCWHCPRGRGWIHNGDPRAFPEACPVCRGQPMRIIDLARALTSTAAAKRRLYAQIRSVLGDRNTTPETCMHVLNSIPRRALEAV